jgi:6-phosphogluconolactonase (cycloisomerase 2 family)
MCCHFKSILMALVFAAFFHAPASALNTNTTSNAAAKTTILVGTQDNIDDLVYAITWNGKDKIEYLTQTNVTHKVPSWLALHPTDKKKLLVIYEDSAKHQNFKIGEDGKLTAEFKAMKSGPGPSSGFGTFSKDGKYMVFVDYPNGGYHVARYLADGTSYPIPQKENLDDPNRYLGPNPSHLSHPHQFVEHPRLDVSYIPNLATNLTSFYHFKDGKMTSQGSLKVDGGPRHMVVNKEGTFGWILTEISCMIQPVKIDETGVLAYNGKPVAITQANQAVGAGAEILLSHDGRTIVASNRQTEGHQTDYLTTFEVDSEGRLTKPTTYDTNGQVIRGMAFNKDSTLLVFGHEANGTIGMFGRDLETNKLTLLTPQMLNLTAAAKIQSPASPSSFVFLD